MILLTIESFLERNQNLKREELDDIIARAKERSLLIDKEYDAFITLNDNLAVESKGILYGVAISVKDNICTKGLRTTAGSRILESYIPPFDATVIEKVKRAGGFIIGKTAMDEFGFGSFSINCAYKIPKNPNDKERVTGGSSGGAAAVTKAADFPHIAIAQSTGGSITAPAAFTGTVGITPTYGRVSRYGLIDYSNSMDKIGTIGKDVFDAALLLQIIQGYDPRDSTSIKLNEESYIDSMNKEIKGFKIAIPKEYYDYNYVDKRVADKIMDSLSKLEELGASFDIISMPMYKYAISAYYIVAISEASTNLARYSGLRYGLQKQLDSSLTFDEYASIIREQGFGEEAKRRIILGTFARMSGYRDAFYLKALKIRKLLIDDYKRVFSRYDAIITPSMPVIAPKIKDALSMEPLKVYGMDIMTVGPNFTGMPTISIPVARVEGMPIGMQIVGDHFNEAKIIRIARNLEKVLNYE
ncbi:MAG: glutamyl-tRNA(Gln) amidotransferase subunit A [Candidatus Micrarchaeota archaeon]|nr:MAG: glutamyl-tRNA(Gln) amidotransferase subunit A [Candidatus Micrarchaeota archaeon]